MIIIILACNIQLRNIGFYLLGNIGGTMDTAMRADFRTQTRGYTLQLEPDLFGHLIITRHWFGLENGRGRTKKQVFYKWEEATNEFSRVEKVRLRRGYTRVN